MPQAIPSWEIHNKVRKGCRSSCMLNLFCIFIPVCNILSHLRCICSCSNFCIAFSTHTHGHIWAHSHTLCSLGFKLTLSLPRGAVRRGTNRRPQRSAQAAAMWYVQAAGSEGGGRPAYTLHPLSYPRETERGRNWQLTMKSWLSISPWWRLGVGVAVSTLGWVRGFIMGRCVFLSLYVKRWRGEE